MSNLTAYFDESGSETDTPVVVVAGVIASVQQWGKFNRQWDKVLQSEKIDFLHMKDLAHFRGKFKGWPEDRRRSFLMRLLEIIESHTRYYLVSVLKIDEFAKIKPEFESVKLSAYQFCCEQCMAGVSNYVIASNRRRQMDVIFEQGNKYMSEGMQLYSQVTKSDWLREKWKIHSIAHANKLEAKPLQAADLLAYETFLDYKKFLTNSLRPTRKPFERFVGSKKLYCYRNDTPDSIRKHFEITLANRRIQMETKNSLEGFSRDS